MDLLTGKVKSLYFRYLAAAFGSTLISSIYSLVDTAMVGQYQGPSGAAALAVVAPVWNVIYSLGLLTGIGGSVIFSIRRGSAEKGGENQYFTAAVLGSVLLALLAWVGVLCFEGPVLTFFRREFVPSAPGKGIHAPGKGGVPPVPFESDALRLSAQRRQPHAGDAGRAGRRYL